MKTNETTLSDCPLKTRVIRNIINSKTKEQFNNSKRYADLAGMLEDELVKEWIQFKMAISAFNSPF
jgi:hypothetical protein